MGMITLLVVSSQRALLYNIDSDPSDSIGTAVTLTPRRYESLGANDGGWWRKGAMFINGVM